MKVIVTGATGFVGLNVCEELIARGCEVVGLARGTKDPKPLQDLGARFVRADLLGGRSLAPLLSGADAVVHLASPHPFKGPREERRRGHAEATKNLVEAMLRAGIKRLVYASVAEVTGPLRELPADESHPEEPTWDHARFKLEAENLIESYGGRGIEYTVLRMVPIYGPRQVGDGFHLLFRGIARGELWTRFFLGSGENLVQFVYVKDVARAFAEALERPVSIGKKYFIAEDRAYKYREFCSILYPLLGRDPPRKGVPPRLAKIASRLASPFVRNPFLNPETVNLLSSSSFYSVERAKRELNFAPTRLETAMRETIEWYRDANLL